MPTLVGRHIYVSGSDPVRCLAFIKRDGFADQIPYLANRMLAAARPIEHAKLVQRLTALGMTMAPNRPPAEASVWVHETARLLRDLAEDIVCEAIDEHQRKSKFLPTVAEIRELADLPMAGRRREAAMLDAMARLIASGASIPELPAPAPPQPPRAPASPLNAAETEELNAMLAKIGAVTRYRPDGSRYEAEPSANRAESRGPRRKPTRQDYLDMGIDPAVLDAMDQEQSAFATG